MGWKRLVRSSGHETETGRIRPTPSDQPLTRSRPRWQIRFPESKSGPVMDRSLGGALSHGFPATDSPTSALRFSPEANILTAGNALTQPMAMLYLSGLQDNRTVTAGHMPVSLWPVVSHAPDRFACRADLSHHQPETKRRRAP